MERTLRLHGNCYSGCQGLGRVERQMRQKIENIKRKVGVYRELNRVSHNFKQATILKLFSTKLVDGKGSGVQGWRVYSFVCSFLRDVVV